MSHTRGDLGRGALLARVPLALALAFAGAFPRAAHADAPEVRATLTYEVMPGAEACPVERVVREQVALHLGYDPFHDDGSAHVTVRLSPRPGGLHAAISVDTQQQPGKAPAIRELESEGPSCDELLRSLVLTVSLAVDPLSLTRAPRVPASPAPVPASRPALSTAAHAQPSSPPSSTPWNIELGAAIRGGYALLPGGGSLGPVVDLRIGKRGWALLAEAGADLPTGHATNASASVSASLLRGGLGACALPGWLMLCAQVDAGELEGTGQGAAKLTGSSFYLDAAAAAGVNLRLSSDLRLQILADVVVPITRTSLNFQEGKTSASIWSSSTLAGLLNAGVAYRF